MSIVFLMKKAQYGDKIAILEIVNRYHNLLLKNSFIEGQTKEEREDFIRFLTMYLIEAIQQFDFNFSRK